MTRILSPARRAAPAAGYAYHKWAEITIDGTAYAFDPQLDQSYAQKGLGEYSNFCKTYEQINGRYIKA